MNNISWLKIAIFLIYVQGYLFAGWFYKFAPKEKKGKFQKLRIMYIILITPFFIILNGVLGIPSPDEILIVAVLIGSLIAIQGVIIGRIRKKQMQKISGSNSEKNQGQTSTIDR